MAESTSICACCLPLNAIIPKVRNLLILTLDIEYGDVAELCSLLSEGSKLLAAYSKAILNSDS
jgi:hypothetical protein